MSKFPGLIVAGAILLAGCNLSSDLSTTQRLGFISVTQRGEGDTATLNIVGQFLQSSPTIRPNIPNTAAAPDTCSVSDYHGPPDPQPPIKVDNLNAGNAITIKTDKAEATLVPVVNMAGSVDYRLSEGPVPFTPGSDVSIEIPGDSGGFPARSLKVATLAAPDFAPIERHPEEELQLSWSAGGASLGAVQLQFLYGSTDSTVSANREMFCSLRDDGSYTIPKFAVAGEWATSADDAQSVSAFRVNTTIQQDGDVLLDVIVQVQAKPVTLTGAESTADLRATATR